jgi:PAS domain S-box-containing protein
MPQRDRRSWSSELSLLQTVLLAAAAAFLVASVVAHLWLTDADEPVLLYTVPVVLVAIAAGPAGGVLAATLATGLYVVWAHDSGSQPTHPAIRIAALYAVALPVGFLVAELRRASSHREWLLEQGGTGVVETDAGGRIAAVNAAAERQLGLVRAALLGRPIDTILPGVRDEHGVVDRVVEHPDGTSLALEVIVERRGAATTLALRDLTDRRRADAAGRQSHDRGRALLALHESEARFRGAVETMLDPFGIFTALRGADGEIVDFTCTYVNRAAAREAGWPEQDLTNARMSEIWPGGQRRALDVYRRVVETGEPAQLDLQRSDPATGATRIFDVRAVAFEDGYAATWRDITERIKMEGEIAAASRELVRSNAALEEFARVVSHDLTEPLWTASLYAQALGARTRDGDNGVYDLVGNMGHALELMQERVHDLLMHAQIRGETLQRELVDTGQAAGDAMHALEASARSARASIDTGVLPSVVGDRVHIRQLFQNLLSNAIKYSRDDAPPVIKVSAVAEGTGWHFRIEDNGVGVREADRERIFEVFQRGPAGDRPGTGIGLAVCRKIVELHGGRIWAEPNAGPGATFHFTLPSAP